VAAHDELRRGLAGWANYLRHLSSCDKPNLSPQADSGGATWPNPGEAQGSHPIGSEVSGLTAIAWATTTQATALSTFNTVGLSSIPPSPLPPATTSWSAEIWPVRPRAADLDHDGDRLGRDGRGAAPVCSRRWAERL